MFQLFNNVISNGTVNIISSGTPCKDSNVLLKSLLDQPLIIDINAGNFED